MTIAITSYNRYELTIKSFEKVLEDERIGEVVIIDDKSTDGSFERLQEYFKSHTKVEVFQNEINLDCYKNKREAIKASTHSHVLILDSDNEIDASYIDTIYKENWRDDTIFAPSYARPSFDYRQFNNVLITKYNISSLIENTTLQTALNTSNYFVPRKAFLQAFDLSVNPHTAEAFYTNYRFLEAGGRIKIVENLWYDHLVHDESHYKKNVHKTEGFYEEVLNKYKQLS